MGFQFDGRKGLPSCLCTWFVLTHGCVFFITQAWGSVSCFIALPAGCLINFNNRIKPYEEIRSAEISSGSCGFLYIANEIKNFFKVKNMLEFYFNFTLILIFS